jgi:hypothetical protein
VPFAGKTDPARLMLVRALDAGVPNNFTNQLEQYPSD